MANTLVSGSGSDIPLIPFPPVVGTYPGWGVRAEYAPPMKEAFVIWRQEDEVGKDMRNSKLRSLTVAGQKIYYMKIYFFA